MPFRAFRIAMLSAVNTGPHERPHILQHEGYEWLIVRRSGVDGQFLTIAQAGRTKRRDAKAAPAGLRPGSTYVAMLVRDSRRECAKAEFIFMRNCPEELEPDGSFVPCEGYATLRRDAGALRLRATGRQLRERRPVLMVPNTPNGVRSVYATRDRQNWHLSAEQLPWPDAVV